MRDALDADLATLEKLVAVYERINKNVDMFGGFLNLPAQEMEKTMNVFAGRVRVACDYFNFAERDS